MSKAIQTLVLGSGGLLGSAFAGSDGDVRAASVRDPDDAYDLVLDLRPRCVVNCAADTDVEGAERDPAKSFQANVLLPERIAQACARTGAVLVHVSSTGCYGTQEHRPYTEEDPPRPTTVHHAHKLDGEDRVRATTCEALILRTGWLFGGRPGQTKNFVWNRMREARSASRMTSDPFQRGNPTFVEDVVRQCSLLLAHDARGVFNCVSSPAVTRLEYVRAIVSAAGLPCEVVAADAPFKRLARVSPNEAAENKRLDERGLDVMRPWSESLSTYVGALLASDAWQQP